MRAKQEKWISLINAVSLETAILRIFSFFRHKELRLQLQYLEVGEKFDILKSHHFAILSTFIFQTYVALGKIFKSTVQNFGKS